MIRVEINPELLSWARERAGYDLDALAHRFPKPTAWERGTAKPTLKEIEEFASAASTNPAPTSTARSITWFTTSTN